jgi:pyruvate formate lyase activating enzyme
MRCGYCYNPDIVKGKGNLLLSHALKFIASRKGLLDGVVLSGGECTLYREIIGIAEAVKSMGMDVKIDTNVSRPQVLKALIGKNLVDYIALDFKALPQVFGRITHSDHFDRFEESLEILLQADIPFEVRTTVHSALISRKSLFNMVDHLASKGYKGNYYLQHFVGDTTTLADPAVVDDLVKRRG